MFGIAKRKAIRMAVDALSPMLNVLASTSGLTKGFWEDEYVLGYMYGSIGVFSKIATGGAIKGTELGEATMAAFAELSGVDGVTMARRIAPFIKSQAQDFQAGLRNAEIVISVAYGLKHNDLNPEVIAARQAVSRPGYPDFGGGSPDAQASAYLQEKFFSGVIAKRLPQQ